MNETCQLISPCKYSEGNATKDSKKQSMFVMEIAQ